MGLSAEQKAALNRFLDVADKNRFTDGAVIMGSAIALCVENFNNAVEVFDDITAIAKEHPSEEDFIEILRKKYWQE